ncbi:hypothetical protein RRG08_043983 [Elysia crispata]|uniref:Uncharacterized protein n=1 Tax=Elysia crispata TaxID=231223 RepID=A0AAE0ZIM9_9GAST|nr:hypothetical protein RRG08_043983 [Elysia crispata]
MLQYRLSYFAQIHLPGDTSTFQQSLAQSMLCAAVQTLLFRSEIQALSSRALLSPCFVLQYRLSYFARRYKHFPAEPCSVHALCCITDSLISLGDTSTFQQSLVHSMLCAAVQTLLFRSEIQALSSRALLSPRFVLQYRLSYFAQIHLPGDTSTFQQSLAQSMLCAAVQTLLFRSEIQALSSRALLSPCFVLHYRLSYFARRYKHFPAEPCSVHALCCSTDSLISLGDTSTFQQSLAQSTLCAVVQTLLFRPDPLARRYKHFPAEPCSVHALCCSTDSLISPRSTCPEI